MLTVAALPITDAFAAESLRATWQVLAGPVDLPPMFGHRAFYDARRQRVFFVDGRRPRELWSVSTAAGESWSPRMQAIAGPDYPSSRYEAAVVHDADGDRVIVYGGSSNAPDREDVWELSLALIPRWTRLGIAGESPGPRQESAAIYDPIRRRMILFGGRGRDLDTWELDLSGTPVWRKLVTSGRAPAPREGAMAVYDPWKDRMVMFGGWVWNDGVTPGSYYISDATFVLPLSGPAVWDSLKTWPRPRARRSAAFALDHERRRIILSSGSGWQHGYALDDVWSIDLETLAWSRFPTVGIAPGPVTNVAGASTPERDWIQFGGIGPNIQDRAFLFEFANTSWRPIDPESPVPFPPRRPNSLLLDDSDGPGLLMWGGTWYHDLWRFDERPEPTWTRLDSEGTATTVGASAFVHDTKRHRLIGIGAGMTPLELPLTGRRVWTVLRAEGPPPPVRTTFGAIYDAPRDRVLLFGGHVYPRPSSRQAIDFADLWELALDPPRWRKLEAAAGPRARFGHHAIHDRVRDRLLIVGGSWSGYASSWPLCDNWALDLRRDSLSWQSLGAPLPAEAQVALDAARDRLVAWDGDRSAWVLSLEDPTAWREVAVFGEPPTSRTGAGIMYDESEDRLVIHGGNLAGSPTLSHAGDVHALDFGRRVSIDVEPGDPDDRVVLGSSALAECAILSDSGFSPDSVDGESVRLAGAAPHGGRWRGAGRDVNGDGRQDLVLKFAIASMRLRPGDSLVRLTGETPHSSIVGLGRIRPRVHAERETQLASSPPVSDPRLALSVRVPGIGSLSLVISVPDGADAALDVFDVSGRRVRDQHVTPGPDQRLDVRGLRPGVYLVRLTRGQERLHARAIVLH